MPTRRAILLASTATALSSLWMPSRSQPFPPPPRIRYNAASQQGKAMMRIYAEGVKAMKALGAQNGRSWTFQWYIHATPQPKSQVISDVFGDTMGPARNLANDTWFTCQSHLGQAEDYFLPWHRLYVLHFEEIIRSITGREEFTLPYWDYTSAASYSIPDEFQAKNRNDPLFSFLFVLNRNKDGGSLLSADVNAGQPLNKHFTGPRNFLVLPDITQSDYSSFCGQLDQNLHGAIHVYTGDGTNMGRVPTAAGDPVFWLHHCNIDRIWAKWNASGGQNPTQTNGVNWTDTKFFFVDSRGDRVEIAISSVASSSALPYSYDALPEVPVMPFVVAGSSPARNRRLLSSSALTPAPAGEELASPKPIAVQLGAAPQTVRLVPTESQNRLLTIAPEFQVGGPSRLVLMLKDVQAQADPNTTYQVFLDLPPNASSEVADQHYVGLLNFFGVTVESDAPHGGRTVEFDVTDVVARLRDRNNLQNDTSVTLIPVGPPSESSTPIISGGIELHSR